MKKTIAILLVLVIGMAGVFAADQTSSSIDITTTVDEFMHIGITDKDNNSLTGTAFDNETNFLSEVGTFVEYDTSDFGTLSTFESSTLIAYIWGITNTVSSDLTVNISTEGFYGLTDTDSNIPLKLNGDDDSTTMTIPVAEGNGLGTLSSSNSLSVMEKTAGSINLAPAQEYEATITIEITT